MLETSHQNGGGSGDAVENSLNLLNYEKDYSNDNETNNNNDVLILDAIVL